MERKSQEIAVPAEGGKDNVSTARRAYEAPRIIRRQQVIASTLVSGDQCVFDPPNPDGSCP